MISARVLMFLRNAPGSADVITEAPGFFTPRMVMQVCTASHTTATPSGLSSSLMISAIWLISRLAVNQRHDFRAGANVLAERSAHRRRDHRSAERSART